jgi:hypothetical protein
MKAMMSDTWPTPYATGADEATQAAITAGYSTPEMALFEARAILAVSEATNPDAGIFGQQVSIDALRDGLKCLRGAPGKRYSIRTEEAQILVSALSAFVEASL